MYQTKKTFVKPDMKMAELIFENPSLLMLIEHFGIDLVVHDYTVDQFSRQHNINPELFIFFCNLYNGFSPAGTGNFKKEDITSIIYFLRNSHNYYKNDKYPEIREYIKLLFQKNNMAEIKMVEIFFNDYFNEVTEHLNYEDQVAFPEICANLGLERRDNVNDHGMFSVTTYRDHHTDIESKLSELKNLLLKYIPLNDDRIIRRKLLISLFELEFDLSLHSLIEETILIPLVKKFEIEKENGRQEN
jgi:regulator of cell morphogenesis and NO signaling